MPTNIKEPITTTGKLREALADITALLQEQNMLLRQMISGVAPGTTASVSPSRQNELRKAAQAMAMQMEQQRAANAAIRQQLDTLIVPVARQKGKQQGRMSDEDRKATNKENRRLAKERMKR